MKKILIIIVLVALGVASFIAWRMMREDQAPADSNPIDFPIAGTNDDTPAARSTIVIAGVDGQIEVNDFLKSSETYPDPINPGYYYLGNPPPEEKTQSDSSFEIIYIAETSYFNIVLNKEPIGESRKAAESYLMSVLGIGQSDMCRLVYTLGVPNYVNSAYSGSSLGFSFCPGAVPLP